MLTEALLWLFLLLTGVLAGVLVAVETAVVPMLVALPGDRFAETHRLLDPGFDPLMPRVNKVTLATGVVLVVLVDGVPATVALAAAVLGVVGVALVSETVNVRLNRRIEAWGDGAPPSGWSALRHRWTRANRLRTVFAVLAFGAAAAGSLLA